ncbi:PqqD family protein [candidate division WOR-3 bacterium]|nr:PqqD family protein [candidate division WOR-3 bacterium]
MSTETLPMPDLTVPDPPMPNPAAVRDDGADGWTLLVNPDTAGAMAVNATGVLVWSLVDGKRTIEQIVTAVMDRFPDAPDTVRDDVLAYLTKLTEEGFIGQEIPFPSTNH